MLRASFARIRPLLAQTGESAALRSAVRCNASAVSSAGTGGTAPPPPPPGTPLGGVAGSGIGGGIIVEGELSGRNVNNLTPRQIVELLDNHIIGQQDAKKAVAVALRNRFRRQKLPQDVRDEVYPKNILMIGPTGVGKTEIARRLAKITNSPFIKVECTKFTEVGFVGRDVETIIDDLLKVARKNVQEQMKVKNKPEAVKSAEKKILETLSGGDPKATQQFKARLEANDEELLSQTITVEVPAPVDTGMGGAQLQNILRGMFSSHKAKTMQRKLPVSEALKVLTQAELEYMMDEEEVLKIAKVQVEEEGIVVLDEIDKIVVSPDKARGGSASDEGVQQDLLPLIEGTTVTTGSARERHPLAARDVPQMQIKTDRILFIVSGAFHLVKPSDMLAELQGRLPIRVELQPLTEKDFLRILSEPQANILKQAKALLKTEDVELEFTDDAVKALARSAYTANMKIQNIGARRLMTVTERVLEEISFNAPKHKGQTYTITKEIVDERLKEMLQQEDLSSSIL